MTRKIAVMLIVNEISKCIIFSTLNLIYEVNSSEKRNGPSHFPFLASDT